MKHVTISCVIPTLGRGEILCQTIQMLLDQSYPPHEIIVVDQTPAPDEQTHRKLEGWHKQEAIRWLHQTEANASKARNAGALAASGEVVLFLDDDIRIQPDFLAAYAETFARTGAPAVSGQILEADDETVDTLPARALDPEIGWLYFRKNYSKECETGFMMAGNVAIRRDLFFEVGGMDENYDKGAYREESDFALRFARAGYRFHYNGRCTIHHLGASVVIGGGARSWRHERAFWYFHHCVGDWYFNLRFVSLRMFFPLFSRSFQAFVVNQARQRPWMIPCTFAFWLAAAPYALVRRLRGPRLCFGQVDSNSYLGMLAE